MLSALMRHNPGDRAAWCLLSDGRVFVDRGGSFDYKFTVPGQAQSGCRHLRDGSTVIFGLVRTVGDVTPGPESTPGVKYIKLAVSFDGGDNFQIVYAPVNILAGDDLFARSIVRAGSGYALLAGVNNGSFGAVNYTTGARNSSWSFIAYSSDGLSWSQSSHPNVLQTHENPSNPGEFMRMTNVISASGVWLLDGSNAVVAALTASTYKVQGFGNWGSLFDFGQITVAYDSDNGTSFSTGKTITDFDSATAWFNSTKALVAVPGQGFLVLAYYGDDNSVRRMSRSVTGGWGGITTIGSLSADIDLLGAGADKSGRVLLVLADSPSSARFYTSDDLGLSWTLRRTKSTSLNPFRIAGNSEKMFAANISTGVDVSRDRGVSWTEVPFNPSVVSVLPQQILI